VGIVGTIPTGDVHMIPQHMLLQHVQEMGSVRMYSSLYDEVSVKLSAVSA
jgi:hypothetical protein